MENPIIACDVSKGRSHIQGFMGLSKPFCNPFEVQHLRSDLRKLKQLAESLRKQTGRNPVFVFEYTGIYHECIARYVQEIGLKSYAISPLESAKVRKSSIRVTKTDSKDCLNIATVYYSRNIREFINGNNDIKALSRRKRDLRCVLIRQKCIYHRYLDLIWPCFDEKFGIDSQSSRRIILSYLHPDKLKKANVKSIANHLLNYCYLGNSRALTIAQKAKDFASDCVSGVSEKSEYVNALSEVLTSLIKTEETIENINEHMEFLLRKNPYYCLLQSIPGVGRNILLQMIGELGDFSRFKTAKQFVAYCGLDPSILQSGNNDGKHFSITRKGSEILRSSLYLAVNQMLTQHKDNQITRFYLKKKSSGLSHKVAAVASCRKLACCVFGMLHNGTCFETI